MKFVVLLLAFGYVVTTHASSLLPVHPGVGGFYKGPNSETIIKGPDGSVITAAAEGGAVQVDSKVAPIVVAEGANPLSVIPLATADVASSSASAVSTASVAVAQSAVSVGQPPVVVGKAAPVIETEIVDAPVIEPVQSSDLVGPSGSVSTRGSSSIVSGPASTTISGPAVVAPVAVVGVNSVPLSVVTPGPIISSEPVSVVTGSPVISSTISPLSLHDSVAIQTLPGRAVPIVNSDGLNGIISQTAISLQAPVTSLPILSSSPLPLQPTTLTGISSLATSGVSGKLDLPTVTPAAKLDYIISQSGRKEAAIDQQNLQAQAQQILDSEIQRANEQQARISAEAAIARADEEQSRLRNAAVAVEAARAHHEIEEQRRLQAQAQEILGRRLQQAVIDSTQINLNPASIPAANIVPPGVSLASKPVVVQGVVSPQSSDTQDVIGTNLLSTVRPRIPGAAAVHRSFGRRPAGAIIDSKLGSLGTPYGGSRHSFGRRPAGTVIDSKLGVLGASNTALFTPNVNTVNGISGRVNLVGENVYTNTASANAVSGRLDFTPGQTNANLASAGAVNGNLYFGDEGTNAAQASSQQVNAKLGDFSSEANTLVVQQNPVTINGPVLTGNPKTESVFVTSYSSQTAAGDRIAESSINVGSAKLRPIDNQPLLAEALRREGVDLSQINLATVPLSAVHQIKTNGGFVPIEPYGWPRYGRGLKPEKKKKKADKAEQ